MYLNTYISVSRFLSNHFIT